MIKWFVSVCLLLGYGTIIAHSVDISSTILSEQKDNQWVLQVRGALAGIEYEVKERFGENSFSTPEEFRALVLEYMQEHISIQFNGENKAVLKNGIVRLGHETNVVFQVIGLPETINSLLIKNSSFKDISRNQSALIIFKEGFAKKQFLLNSENEHTVALNAENHMFVLATQNEWKIAYTLLAVLGGFLIVFFAFRLLKQKYFSHSKMVVAGF